MTTTVRKTGSYTEEEVTAGLLALISWTGNAAAAARALKAEGRLDVSSSTLTRWAREVHAARYDELREKYQEQIERGLIQELRELAGLALQGERMAVEKAMARLELNKDEDPGRTAANLARVAQSNTDKMLSLSGRPTSIREDRNLEEIMRSLAAKGVIQLPEAVVVEEQQQIPRTSE